LLVTRMVAWLPFTIESTRCSLMNHKALRQSSAAVQLRRSFVLGCLVYTDETWILPAWPLRPTWRRYDLRKPE
jgi:hypothetical protein